MVGEASRGKSPRVSADLCDRRVSYVLVTEKTNNSFLKILKTFTSNRTLLLIRGWFLKFSFSFHRTLDESGVKVHAFRCRSRSSSEPLFAFHGCIFWRPKMSFGRGKIQKLRYKRVRSLNFTTNAPLFVRPRAGSYGTLPGQTHANTSLSAADNLGVDNVIDLPNIEPAIRRTTVLSLYFNN